MCTSNPYAITCGITELMKYKPIKSILEIGPGFGKWGVLFREYLEYWGPHHISKDQWTLQLDCIEAYKPYITELHQYIYNNIIVDDVLNVDFNKLQNYDIIFMCDVIEHIEKDKALKLLKILHEKCNKAIFIGTPSIPAFRGKIHKDDFEQHVSYFSSEEWFKIFPDNYVQIFDNSSGIKGFETYLAVISKEKPGELK